jgi:hypothetical protein
MNDKLLPILAAMFPELPLEKELGTMGARQIYFETETHECSVTVFNPSESEIKHLEAMKHSCRFDNDIAWVGNTRFAATSKI